MAVTKKKHTQTEPEFPQHSQIDETVTLSILDMLNGYAYCQMLFEDGRPQDFIYLRVNKSFETLTGLKDVVGKKVSEVIPGILQSDPHLIETYGRVAQTGQPERFETFLRALQRWFSVSVYCPQPEYFVAVFDEISEKKKLQSAAAENERRLREVLEYSLDAAYKRSLQADSYEYFSPVITRLIGYTPEEMQAFDTPTVLSLMHAEDVAQVEKVMMQSLLAEPGTAHQVEYRFRHKDGTYRWLQDKFVVAHGPEGLPEARIGSVSDITARKEAEQKAQVQGLRSQILLENSRDGIHVLDEDGRVVEANQAFCEMLGYTRAELLQMHVSDWDAQWSKDQLRIMLDDLLIQPALFETQHRRKDGSLRDVEINAIGVIVEGKSHLYASTRDITERKKTLRQLQQWEHIFTNVNWGVVASDPTGKIFARLNPAFAHMHGWHQEELIGTPILDIFSPAKRADAETQIEIAHQKGHHLFESEHVRKDGSIFPVSVNVTVVRDQSGNFLYRSANVEDISERKRSEESLINSEARLRAIIEASPVPMALNDDQQNITSLNLAFTQTFGYTLADIPTLADWWPKAYPDPGYRQWVATTWQTRLLEAKTTKTAFQPLEINVRCKDGAEKTVIASAAAISVGFEGVHLVVLYDISERKRYEQALRASEENLQIALEGAEIGMWSLNVKTMTGRVDSRAAQILGYESEDIPNEKIGWDQMTHPDDVPQIGKILAAHLAGEIPIFESEHRMLHANGQYVWVSGRGKVTHFDMDGTPLMISGTILNITQRKLASIALGESEEKYHQFFEQSSEGIAIMDESGCVVEWNPALEKISGLKRSQVVGKTILEVQIDLSVTIPTAEILERQKTMIQLALQTGKAPFLNILQESAFKTSDGSEHFAHQHTFAIKTNQGYRLGMLLRDVTEEKQFEKSLRESETKHRRLFETMAQGVIYYDDRGEIISTNPAAEKILGLSKIKLEGKTFKNPDWKVVREDGSPLPAGEHPISVVLHSGKPVSAFTLGIYNPIKNSYLWLSITAVPLFLPGENKPFQVYSTFEDITERKTLEDALRKNEQKFQSVFTALSEGIVMQNEAGEIMLCNPSALRILGLTADQMMGRISVDPLWRAVHPDGSAFPGAEHPAMRTLHSGQPYFNVPMGVHKPDGSLTWIIINTVPLFNPTETKPYAVVSTFSDITEYQKTVNALRESEARFRTMADSAPMLLWQSGTDAACDYFNRPWLEFTGRSLEQELGGGWMEGIHPDDYQHCQDLIQISFGKQVKFEMEYRLRRFDGEYRWLLDNGMPRFTPDGTFLGYIGACIDITDRKNALAALQASEINLKTVFNATDDSIFLIDRDETLLALNDTAARRMGQPGRDLVGQKFYDLLPPEAIQRRRPFIDRAILHGEHDNFEDQRSGRWMNNHLHPILDEGGQVVRMVIYSRDITENKLAAEQIRESEARLNTIYRTSPISIVISRLEDNHCIEVNPAFEKLTGYTRSEILGKTFVELNLWGKPEMRQIFQEKLLATGAIHNIETQFRSKNGDILDMLISSEIIDLRGEKCLLSIGQNITERKRMERELQAQRDFATQIINLMGQGLTVTDAAGKFEFINPAYAAMTGYQAEELIGKDPTDVTLLEDRRVITEQKVQRLAGKATTYETRLQRVDGEMTPVLITGVPRKTGDTSYGAIAVITDLSEQKRIQDELRSAKNALEQALEREQVFARTDVLTGVNNRRQLFALAEERIAVAARYKQPLAVMMFDIDHFKQVNDGYGHDIGDQALQRVVQTARAELRAADVIGRYGGEEFIIVMPVTSARQALPLAERIRTNIANLVITSDRGAITLTVSIGVVELKSSLPPESVENLFRRADVVMYSAKNAGRNRTMMIES